MINFDDYTNENKTEHNLKWPYIPDHPYRRFWIRKNKCIIKFNKQSTRYLYAKDPYEEKINI